MMDTWLYFHTEIVPHDVQEWHLFTLQVEIVTLAWHTCSCLTKYDSSDVITNALNKWLYNKVHK